MWFCFCCVLVVVLFYCVFRFLQCLFFVFRFVLLYDLASCQGGERDRDIIFATLSSRNHAFDNILNQATHATGEQLSRGYTTIETHLTDQLALGVRLLPSTQTCGTNVY